MYQREIKCEGMVRNELWWVVSGGAFYEHPNVNPPFVTQEISWPVK